MKNIKFVCNRTGYKKTFNVNEYIFERYSMVFPEPAWARLSLESHIQKMSDKSFFQLVNKKYLDQFMLSEIGVK
jgi:hypothetical protein